MAAPDSIKLTFPIKDSCHCFCCQSVKMEQDDRVYIDRKFRVKPFDDSYGGKYLSAFKTTQRIDEYIHSNLARTEGRPGVDYVKKVFQVDMTKDNCKFTFGQMTSLQRMVTNISTRKENGTQVQQESREENP